jgi:hypothetical protein
MRQSQIDLEAFRNFERATHDKLAESYYDAFSAVTDRAIEPLLKAACVENETRLLDVATGPGTLAASGGTWRARYRHRHRTCNDRARACPSSASRLSRGER